MSDDLRDLFLAYCRDFSYYKPRATPLNERTLARYLRGLQLVEKLIGHNLNEVSEEDQLLFMEKIKTYAQGTRRVSTQIFQRFIAWGIRNGFLSCPNLIVGKEDLIIGENKPTKYKRISKQRINRFFMKLKTPELRMLFGLIYYGGLHLDEVLTLTKEHITDHGLFVFRSVRKESMIIPLPNGLLSELCAYAETKEDKLFDYGVEIKARGRAGELYRMAQVEADELYDTTIKDLRTSGIRHFFEMSQDLKLTKKFAGVPDSKKGWLDSLVEADSYYMQNIARARRYYGESETV